MVTIHFLWHALSDACMRRRTSGGKPSPEMAWGPAPEASRRVEAALCWRPESSGGRDTTADPVEHASFIFHPFIYNYHQLRLCLRLRFNLKSTKLIQKENIFFMCHLMLPHQTNQQMQTLGRLLSLDSVESTADCVSIAMPCFSQRLA